MKIGIIREGKVPPDSRVPLTPKQCAQLIKERQLDIVVQPSEGRCFQDEAYRTLNIPMSDDLSDCDVLMGVKEIPVDQLIPDKTYFFFSHTIKEQPYNRKLLQAVIEKKIRLLDYEVLKDERGRRLIAFGKFAGMVGAHNGIMTYGKRTASFSLPRMKDFHDYAEAVEAYETMQFPPFRVVLTGSGRVGKGAALVLDDMGIKKVLPADYLVNTYNHPVYTQLVCEDYAQRKDGTPFDKRNFYDHPELYESRFKPYSFVSDIMINGIYWDNEAPVFFTLDEMRSNKFNIQVIADVTCDIAPVSSIPSTIKASTIAKPVFGFNPHTESEEVPYQEDVIDMMTVDNLPNELPRDASRSFGEQFIENILDEVLANESAVIERATVAANGKLGMHFGYLENYLNHE
jgi:alanine dehydrogenase